MTRFHKMQGTANDFVVVRADDSYDWIALAPGLCDRRRGIGADGILIVGGADGADFSMRLVNADGSEGEMCGNGIRCTAKYVLDEGLTDRRALKWETGAGLVKTEVLDYAGSGVALVRVDMGPPRFLPAEIPVSADGKDPLHLPLSLNGSGMEVSCVGMGNPHAVAFVDSVDAFPLERLGPEVEHHALFPERTNFEIVEVLSSDRIRMRVWERGVGETQACGTGACAAAVATQVVKGAHAVLEVDVPGGQLKIEWRQGEPVIMTGPAETAFVGEFPAA